MKKSLFLLLILMSTSLFSQWKTSTKTDPFDGKYRSAYVKGKGGEFPYNNPLLVINYFEKSHSLNIYFADIGYSGCDDKAILLKFDKDDKLYVSTHISEGSSGNTNWFFNTDESGYSYVSNRAHTFKSDNEFLEKLKKHSKMTVRINSSCNQKSDYIFSLSGSTRAISYIEQLKKVGDKKINKLKKEVELLKKKKDSLTKSIQKRKDSIEKIRVQKELKRRDSILKANPLTDLDDLKEKAKKIKPVYDFWDREFFVTRLEIKVFQNIYDVEFIYKIPRRTLIVVDQYYSNKDYYKLKYAANVGKVSGYILKEDLKRLFD